jgi:aryl-alcohol dehydrogenase-like predicted oxidoreductase
MEQFALRWILINEAISVVIPGAKNAEQARSNIGAAAFVTCTRRDSAHSIDLRNGRQAIGAPAMVNAQV